MRLFRREKSNTDELPPLPSIDQALDALESAQEAHEQTTRMRKAQRIASDVYVQAILESIKSKE